MQATSSTFPLIQSSAVVSNFSALFGSAASPAAAIVSAPASNPILNLSVPQELGNVVTINGVQFVRQVPVSAQQVPRYPDAVQANPIFLVISDPGGSGVSGLPPTPAAPDQNSLPETTFTEQQQDPQLDYEVQSQAPDELPTQEQAGGERFSFV